MGVAVAGGMGTGIWGGEPSGDDCRGLGVVGAVVDGDEVADRKARLGLRGKRKRDEEREAVPGCGRGGGGSGGRPGEGEVETRSFEGRCAHEF